jgi:hypothetical protein
MFSKKYRSLTISSMSCTLLFASCAGPESYQQKMSRYEPKAISQNIVPEIKSYDFKFIDENHSTEKMMKRSPASAPENPTLESEGSEGATTNKKLYFLTLYSEYETLKKYTPEFSGTNSMICPNFHTSLLRHLDGVVPSNSTPVTSTLKYDSQKFSDEKYVSSRPELLLPMSQTEVTPKVIDLIKNSKEQMSDFAINELVHKALDIHLAKTYSEIRELCEYGNSDNYYIYENLITHIKNNTFAPGNKNMNTLLKTTVFSNIALMMSLEKSSVKTSSRAIASTDESPKKNTYANEIITRLNVSWANQYFNYIKESH